MTIKEKIREKVSAILSDVAPELGARNRIVSERFTNFFYNEPEIANQIDLSDEMRPSKQVPAKPVKEDKVKDNG